MSLRGPAGNIQHSSVGFEDYSDPAIVEAGRVVLEHIDLDPASCELANTVVRAEVFWALDDPNPLAPDCEWGDGDTRIFLNPPGGRCNAAGVPLPRDAKGKQSGPGESYAAHWWEKLLQQYDVGNVHSAIFVCFSLNLFQNCQELGTKKNRRLVRAPFSFPFVIPKQRPRYWSATRPIGKGAPSQPGAVVLLPPKDTAAAYQEACERFHGAFSPLGQVRL